MFSVTYACVALVFILGTGIPLTIWILRRRQQSLVWLHLDESGKAQCSESSVRETQDAFDIGPKAA